MFERFRKRRQDQEAIDRLDDAGIAGDADVGMGIAEPDGVAAEHGNIPGLEMLPGRRMGLGYVQTLQTVMTVNRALLILLLAAIAAVVVLGVALMSSREWITVYVPPDTTRAAVLTAGVPEHATVYGFAWQTLQALNHWPVDGEKDYPEAIAGQTPYLSSDMRQYLLRNVNELKNRFGINELKGRTRALHPLGEALFSPARVRRTADGVWGVQVDTRLVETVETAPVKDIVIRYRLRVVRTGVDPRGNAWGLMLDGFLEPPERIGEMEEPTASAGKCPGPLPAGCRGTDMAFEQSFQLRHPFAQLRHVPVQVPEEHENAEEQGRSDPLIQVFHEEGAGWRLSQDSITGYSGGAS